MIILRLATRDRRNRWHRGDVAGAQAPFSSSGESVPIENSIGLYGAWKALKLFSFFTLHPAGVQLRASVTIEHNAYSYLFNYSSHPPNPVVNWQPH
jgi:hypothetical protein